jgi:hypothetical protein
MADVALSAPAETTSTAVTADTAATPSSSSAETPSVTSTESTGDMVSAAAEIYQRLAAEESPSPAPSEPTPPAQAATAPAPTPETPAEATTRGPIPFDRHKAVITNTRNEASAEARKKTLEEFGIAEGVTPKVVAHGVNLARMLSENPKLFLQIVQSQLGMEAAPAAPAPKPAEDPEPEPDVPLTDGRFVYSAEQLRARDQWRERHLLKQVDDRYGPLREAHEQQTLTTRRRAEAGNMVAAAERWPLFKELRPHVRELIQAHQGALTPTILHDAYITAYQTHGVRLQRESWERERNGQRVDELNRKAGAATVRPGAPQPLTPRATKDKSFEEVAREIYHRAAAE